MTPRGLFERDLLPAFAARFNPSSLVVNIGAGKHAYREYFPCRVVTADPLASCDERWSAEAIPHPDGVFDGVLLMGVFERLDDPMQAVREVRRVLKPGGLLLFSALDLGFPWRKDCDRWRLSPGGAAHVTRAFEVLESDHIDGLAHFFVLKKPTI